MDALAVCWIYEYLVLQRHPLTLPCVGKEFGVNNYSTVQGMVYNTEITLNVFGDDGTSYYWRVLDYDGTNRNGNRNGDIYDK